MTIDDPRFAVALYTVKEAAAHLRMPRTTLLSWVGKDSLIHSLPKEHSRAASLPFIAMAEAQFYLQLRREGLSMQAIATGMRAVREELGDQMLVRGRLAHDSRDILMNLGDRPGAEEWTRARDRQGGLKGVIDRGLTPITWADDNLPQRVRLTAYEGADVIIDPRFVFGQPMVKDSGVRVEDIVQLFLAGEPMQVVGDELGVPESVVESVVRVHVLSAAA